MTTKRDLLCNSAAARVLRLPEVKQRTGLTRDQIAEEEAAGRFPKRLALTLRAVGWLESEISDWIMERAALRDDPAQSEQLKLMRAPLPARRRLQAQREAKSVAAGPV
jgi:prophage regulatory protein